LVYCVDAKQTGKQPGRAPGIFVQRLLGSGSNTDTVAVTMLVLTLDPGAELPLHTHVSEEAFFVLEGTGLALSDDGVTPVQPEMALLAPIGQRHGFRNDTDKPLRIVCSFPVAKT
jgi:quercetin dioxygenase-like cupin family protein